MPSAVIDLFCGIGGLTKGLELANLNVIAGIDINETCKFAYEANNNADFISADITEVSINDICNKYPDGATKILVGCAPCQPFSKYTQRYRKDGHTDNKWRLLYSFIDIVREVHPEIVSMENVPELRNECVFKDFVETLETMGYYVHWQIAYCPDYGVPQKRKRLVLLASLLGNIQLIEPLFDESNYITVRDAIAYLPPIASGEIYQSDSMHRATKLSPLNLKRIQNSVQGGTWKDWDDSLKLKCHQKASGKSYGAVYGRMSWDQPSPTITTQFYGYGNGRFGHPEQNRAISYREGAILQSFPPEYVFIPDDGSEFSLRDLGIHIGNAVPVELGHAIGLSINQHLTQMGVD